MFSKNFHGSRAGVTMVWALALAMVMTALPSFAQDEDQAREQITVTGSRVGRSNLESKVPLTVIDRADIDLKSISTISDLFRTMPEVAGNLLTTAISNGGGDGTSELTLRGLPATQTLVLLNGRRLPPSKFGETPDVNAIPTGAIARVEVLKDGASTLYGTDAIAGVVNIITRQDFDGFEIRGMYGLATKNSDFPNRSIDVLFGKNFEEGNITLGFNWFKQDELRSRDRERSAITTGPSSAPPWTNIGDLGITLGAGSTVEFPSFTGGDYRPFVGGNQPAGDSFNFNSLTTSILELERFSLFGSANYQIHEYVKAFAEFNFTRTDSFWRLAPTPLFALFEDPTVQIHPNQQFMPAGLVNALAGVGTVPDANGLLTVDFRRRNLELGTRNVINENDTKRVVGGFEGDLMEFHWEAAFNWGRTNNNERNTGLLNKTNLAFALGDPAACTALAAVGCVQANIFGSALANNGAGSLTQDMLDWIGVEVGSQALNQVRSFTINVSNDDVFELPGGSIGVAFGVERRNEEIEIIPDSLKQQSATIGSTNQQITSGERDIKEFYGEIVIPVVEMLELDASFRWTDYDSFGSEVVPKISGVFTPLPGLRFRGSWGEGFRAPTLFELFSGGSENFGTFNDPCSDPNLFLTLPGCNGTQSDPNLIQFLSLAGGNPKLQAEESTTWTLGATYELQEPMGILEAFSASIDYYNIDIDQAILSNSQFIIDQAALGNATFLPLVKRNAAGNISVITGGFVNLANRSTEGIDFGFDVSLAEQAWGQISAGLHGTYVISFDDQPDPSSPSADIAGHFIDAASDGLGSIPEWKIVASAQWTRGPFMANVRLNYVDELKEGPFGGVTTSKIDSWTTVDMQGSYTLDVLDTEAVLTMGIDNIGNKKPPFSADAFNDNFDGRTHNLIGRFWYSRVTVNF